jgi:hypothetical protein
MRAPTSGRQRIGSQEDQATAIDDSERGHVNDAIIHTSRNETIVSAIIEKRVAQVAHSYSIQYPCFKIRISHAHDYIIYIDIGRRILMSQSA